MAKLKTKEKQISVSRKQLTEALREKAYKSHILTKKTTKRKRNLRKLTMTDSTNEKVMKKILPYI